jgi:hypothetical protein
MLAFGKKQHQLAEFKEKLLHIQESIENLKDGIQSSKGVPPFPLPHPHTFSCWVLGAHRRRSSVSREISRKDLHLCPLMNLHFPSFHERLPLCVHLTFHYTDCTTEMMAQANQTAFVRVRKLFCKYFAQLVPGKECAFSIALPPCSMHSYTLCSPSGDICKVGSAVEDGNEDACAV